MLTKVMARRAVWSGRIEFVVGASDIEGTFAYIANPLVMVEHEQGLIVEPTFSLDNTEAQQLIDELWNCGLRPSEGTGSAGSLRATEKHLEDMRKIAFMQLEKQ